MLSLLFIYLFILIQLVFLFPNIAMFDKFVAFCKEDPEDHFCCVPRLHTLSVIRHIFQVGFYSHRV